MSQRSRSSGSSGRRPKDLRTGPGRARPPSSRVPKTGVRGGTTVRRSRNGDPRLISAAVVGGLLVLAVLLLGGGLFRGGAGASPSASATVRGSGCPTSQPAALTSGETRTVTIETPKGNIVIKVQGSLSPIAAGNFVVLASCGFYDGIVFHRTASLQDGTPFVIQGGDPKGDGSGGPGYTIQDERVTTTYHRGTVAMARTQDANSQGSQFFIVLSDAAASALASANTYAIFGSVVDGMDVADQIYQASPGSDNVPNPIPMTKVTVANP
ncbi:MAG: peptidylprolyl isomerase [Chloroflexi bacterium]|nr:peptidylprolyl isomerase [Chloroflexota bacterium]